MKDSNVNANSKFDQLGLNFIEFNEVIVQLEITNQISIPDDSLSNVKTVGDLVDLTNFHIINNASKE